MQVLFTKIRQKNIDEVKRILDKHPDAINSPSGPKPKKDHGQSPLQVALKIGAIEIADYLLDHGADVNFMEAEDDDPGVRMPVLFDAIIGAIASLCYRRYEESDGSVRIMKRMLDMGADVNRLHSYGGDAMQCAIFEAYNIISSPTIYTDIQDETWKKLEIVMNLLLDYGFDYEAWMDRHLYPEPSPGPTDREMFFDPIPSEMAVYRKKWQSIRDFIQNYFYKRNLCNK